MAASSSSLQASPGLNGGPAAEGPGGRVRSFLMPGLTLLLFLAAAWAIHRELAAWTFDDVMDAVGAVSANQIVLAVLTAGFSYFFLSFYDPLALRHLGHPLPLRRGAMASFVGYAFSHTLGMPLLTGGAVRFRLYSAWGVAAGDIAGIIAFNSLTLWLGVAAMLVLGGLIAPAEVGTVLRLPASAVVGLAWSLALLLLAYPWLGRLFRRPLTVGDWSFAWPQPSIAAAQLGLAMIDWALAAATLWILLPPIGLGFAAFASLYTVASIAGVISHVPAGLGVFEAVLLIALPAEAHAPGVAAALVIYRLIYYVLPILLAALVFALQQAYSAGGAVVERLELARRGTQLILPTLLATLVFIGGVVLLISGATPALPRRLDWLGPLAPLALIELSHFFGSLAGLALLVLALGLRRRLDAAYWATVGVLAAGIVFSLLKGLDWEEALYLALVLAALLPSHRAFYRRSRLNSQRFSAHWLLAILAVVLGTTWLGFFCYRHVDYANELWWQFVLDGDAPRFLRATIGVVVGAMVLAGLQLVRFAQPRPTEQPAAGGLEPALATLAQAEAPLASVWLAALGDKRFLFSDSGRSFIMYAVQGRSWIAMGEPVGLAAERLELLWRFREQCDAWGGRAVFYEIGPASMPDLVELGLTFYKLGEQGFVPLTSFDLTGSARSGLRQSQRRAQRDGATFEVLQPGTFDDLMPELKSISDGWLKSKHAREKRFSLGRFDPDYLRRFPLALVRKETEIVAFANLWPAPDHGDLSIDLMRYRDRRVHDVMEYLFIELMLWGKAQGFRRFDLGMAPLSGLQERQLAPLWTRAGALLFTYAETFYNFEGLRRYKEKFRPVWEPRYLAAPGGLAAAVVLADVTTLVSGSAAGAVRR